MQPMNQGFNPPGAPGMPPAADDRKSKKTKAPKKKGAPAPGRRYALLAALFAVIVLVAVLATASRKEEQTWVLRAKVAVNSLEAVQEGMLEAVQLPPEAVEPGAVSGDSADAVIEAARGTADDATQKIVGSFPLYPIREGQQLAFEMFTGEGAADIALQPDERLVSVAASTGTAVAGSLRIGDHVDVVSVDPSTGQAGVVAADVEIMSIQVQATAIDSASQRQTSEDGRDLSREDVLPRDPIPGTYVLRTPLATAVAVSIADAQGDLYLLYRAPGAATAPVGIIDLQTVLCTTGTENGVPLEGCGTVVIEGDGTVVEETDGSE